MCFAARTGGSQDRVLAVAGNEKTSSVRPGSRRPDRWVLNGRVLGPLLARDPALGFPRLRGANEICWLVFGVVVMNPGEDLAETFAAIARQLEAEDDLEKTRIRITQAAVDTMEGCDHAAISLITRKGAISTVASTSEVPERVDAIQYQVKQGPCVDTITEQETYQTRDLAQEHRWPRFSQRAVTETGVRSMLSFRLFVQDDTIGALNLYSRRADAFDDHDRSVGAILAAHAAIAMTVSREREHAEHLQTALISNRHIGMAMGILMAREHLTEDQAFAALRTSSQHLNRKLRQIAESVIETGELPQDDRRDRAT